MFQTILFKLFSIMELFRWTDDYSVNSDVCDGEHKKLFDIFNKLLAAFMNREASEKLDEILIELRDYTVYHFDHEEALYTLTDEHKAKHKEFIETVTAFEAKHKKGLPVVQYEMMTYLRTWLINHIKGTDKIEYGEA